MQPPRLLVFALIVAGCVCAAPHLSSQGPQSIPLDVSVPVQPIPVKAAGRWHLVYELHITNYRSAPIELTRLEVLAANSTVTQVNAADLESRLARPGRAAADVPKRVMAGGTTAIVFLDVVFASVPTTDLHHRLYVKLDAEQPTETSLLTAIVSIRSSAPLVLSPPVKGEDWLAMNGLSNDSSHRRTIVVVDGRATIAQRFATDWTRLGSDGQAFHDDPAKNSNWYAYGVDVLSVHAGRVTGAQDGIPENNPAADHKAVSIDLNTVAGNYLIVRIAPQRYALYAHLTPGSIKVRVGDRVKTGDVLARLGNSGNSDAPHLHFHVCDRNSPLGCEGVPYVFDCFSQFGEVPSLEVLTNGVGWKPIESDRPKLRRLELPTRNAVVRFR